MRIRADLRNPSRPPRLLRAALLSLLLVTALGPRTAMAGELRGAGEVRAAVASNFAAAMEQLAPAFERDSGHRLWISLGSTGTLYAQIRNGAPYDVLLAADVERPRRLEADELAVPGTRFTYAQGRLALWSATPGRVGGSEAVLRGAGFRVLAIANPKTAPYGAAARQVLVQMGLWGALQGRLVQGENIAQTFQFVASGHATLGFVALAQLRAQGLDGDAWLPPEAWYDPIAQQALLLRRGEHNPAARALLAFLRGAPARATIVALGYRLP